MVVAIYAPAFAPVDQSVGRALAVVEPGEAGVPLLTVILGQANGPAFSGSDIPNFAFPDDVASVLARVLSYVRWRDVANKTEAETQIHRAQSLAQSDEKQARLKSILAEALASPSGVMPPQSASEFFDLLGVPCVDTRRSSGPLMPLIECRIWAGVHQVLGPFVSFGLTGRGTEANADRVVRLSPFALDEARSMVANSAAGRLISGLDGALETTANVIAILASTMDLHPDIVEIDLDPFVVTPLGCWVAAGSVKVGKPPVDLPIRRLP